MSDTEHRSPSPSPARIDAATTGYYNPSQGLTDRDVTVEVDTSQLNTVNPGGQSAASLLSAGPKTWERFDDDNDGRGGASASQKQTENKSPADHGSASRPQNGGAASAAKIAPPPKISKTLVPSKPAQSSVPSETPAAPQETVSSVPATSVTSTATSQPVRYDVNRDQAVVVMNGGAGAGAVIMTRNIPERWRDLPERPLRATRMKMLKIFSVVAIFLFFPSGIPAAYFAWRTQREFDEGIIQGNIDRAQKLARRTEHLIILSAVLAVITAVLIFALVERAMRGPIENPKYLAPDSVQG